MKKVLLVILDGFGVRKEIDFNAIANAYKPNWDKFLSNYPHTVIDASGKAVGLPDKQFGNSEVGHLNIGAGRVIRQDITRIDEAIDDGTFFTNPIFLQALQLKHSGNVHLLGLLSDGGVHAHIKHIIALLELLGKNPSVKNIWLHVLLDGRDTPPKSALIYLQQLQQVMDNYPHSKIATISGRYYAMDRDKRYDRIKLAYDAIATASASLVGEDAKRVVEDAYASSLSDEFIKPHIIKNYTGMRKGDIVFFANFRADRAIQLTDALTNVNNTFKPFPVQNLQLASFVTMTLYDARLNTLVAFAPNKISNTLGEVVATLGLHQLRIAETEKYPHVTYFFNGGKKEPYVNEDRILIDSPRDVATYDLKPEMSLPLVVTKLDEAIATQKYDLIVTNFANADMVGHSGNFKAAIAAVEAIDDALSRCVRAMLQGGGEVLITADHGNCENMFDFGVNQVHTQHTANLVPCLYIGRHATLRTGGTLQDIAPTILAMMGISKPIEMTGTSLLNFL